MDSQDVSSNCNVNDYKSYQDARPVRQPRPWFASGLFFSRSGYDVSTSMTFYHLFGTVESLLPESTTSASNKGNTGHRVLALVSPESLSLSSRQSFTHRRALSMNSIMFLPGGRSQPVLICKMYPSLFFSLSISFLSCLFSTVSINW